VNDKRLLKGGEHTIRLGRIVRRAVQTLKKRFKRIGGKIVRRAWRTVAT
jgi:hypothetical protein